MSYTLDKLYAHLNLDRAKKTRGIASHPRKANAYMYIHLAFLIMVQLDDFWNKILNLVHFASTQFLNTSLVVHCPQISRYQLSTTLSAQKDFAVFFSV